jgi:hypothetical protein
MKIIFQILFCGLMLFNKFNLSAQNVLEVYRVKMNKNNDSIRESYMLTPQHEAKIITEQYTYRGNIEQIGDSFLILDEQKIAFRNILSIAFKKSEAAYRKQKWTGALLTLPALAFSSLFVASMINNNKSFAQSCFGGVGSLIFIPVAIIWGIPKLFGNKSNFDLYNNKWKMSVVKKS